MKLWQLAIMLGFGGAMGICGLCIGYEMAIRRARSVVKTRADQIAAMADAGWRGDMPTLPAQRDRRFDVIEHRSRLS